MSEEEVKKVKKVKTVEKEEGKGKDKPTKKKMKKEVKVKADGVVEIKHSKALKPEVEINAYTGTRFKPNTSQQMAFDIVYKGAKAGQNAKEIRETLAKTRKDAGSARNLDAGYFPYVVASHPEFFQVLREGGIEKIKVLKTPHPDEKAIAELEAKAAKAAAAKEARKAKGKDKPAKPGKEKPTKVEKEEVKKVKKIVEDNDEDEEEEEDEDEE